MEVLTRNASIRDRIGQWRGADAHVALVPTAGSLHKGHLRLISEARARADHVIVSVFPHASGREPSSQAADRELLQKDPPDVLFVPPIHEIFPAGLENGPVVEVPHLSNVLEGATRPGHFARQMTVLAKQFNLLRPDVAVFGERDYQLLVMMRQLIDDLFLPLELAVCPIVRDYDGLPFSSANRHLSYAQRSVATRLHAILRGIGKRIEGGGRDFLAYELEGFESLAAAGLEPEYLGIRQSSDLAPARADSRELVILAAARIGQARLVDNLKLRLGARL